MIRGFIRPPGGHEKMMDIRFWGVRGSIAAPLTNARLKEKIETILRRAVAAGLTEVGQIPAFLEDLPWHVAHTAGGDTPCVEVRAGDVLIILDAGTGIRRLAAFLREDAAGNPVAAHILLSHTHWDHIHGLPFVDLAFRPENRFTIYSPQPDIAQSIKNQQVPEYFPVPLAPAYEFVQLEAGKPFYIGDVLIETIALEHPGGSYGYGLSRGGKRIVYATDSEYKDLSAEALRPFIDFFRGADLLIYDAQYTMLENVEKENWGHSNILIGVDMALEAEVKQLIFTHHEPTYDDEKLWNILKMAEEYLNLSQPEGGLQVLLAYEGLRMTIT